MDRLSVAQAATVEYDKDAEGRVFHSRRVSLSQRPCFRRSGRLLLRLPCRRRLTLQDSPTNRRDRGTHKAESGEWVRRVGDGRVLLVFPGTVLGFRGGKQAGRR